jgi:hypothetical protein
VEAPFARSRTRPPGFAPDGVGSHAAGDGRAAASGYDRIAVVVDGGGHQWMSKGEFQALALTERVRLLAGGALRFYRGAVQVPASEAMRGLP